MCSFQGIYWECYARLGSENYCDEQNQGFVLLELTNIVGKWELTMIRLEKGNQGKQCEGKEHGAPTQLIGRKDFQAQDLSCNPKEEEVGRKCSQTESTVTYTCKSMFLRPIWGSNSRLQDVPVLCSHSNSRSLQICKIQKTFSGSQLIGQNLPKSVYLIEFFLQLILGKQVSLISQYLEKSLKFMKSNLIYLQFANQKGGHPSRLSFLEHTLVIQLVDMLFTNNMYVVYHQSLSSYEEQILQKCVILIKLHDLKHKYNWKKLCPFTLILGVNLLLIATVSHNSSAAFCLDRGRGYAPSEDLTHQRKCCFQSSGCLCCCESRLGLY